MNLRIILFVAAYFVNVFADRSKWIVHDEIDSFAEDDVDFMSQELLIPVKTKTPPKPKPVKVNVPSKPFNDQSKKDLVQSSFKKDNLKNKKQSHSSLEEELSSEDFIIVTKKKNVTPKSLPVKTKSVSNKDLKLPTKKPIHHPCQDNDVKCNLAKERLETLHLETENLDAGRLKSLLNTVNSARTLTGQPTKNDHVHRHLLEEDEKEDEDILRSINDESINRFRRQLTPDDGGSGTDFYEQSTTTNENPEFSIDMSVTLEDPVPSGQLSDSDKITLRADFEKELTKRFSFFPGFKAIKISTDDIILDSENRPRAKFSIVMDGGAIGALGANPEARVENLTSTIRRAGGVFNNTDPISGSKTLPININVEEFIKKVEILLSDVCESDRPCQPGYVCAPGLTDTGDYIGTCTHACFQSKLNELCQNGAICTLNSNNEPYCQCGSRHTGAFCENEATSTDDTSLSTAEVVGITTGTVLAIAALASCCFFILFCRKRSDKDIDYSTFGDDNNLMQGYLDQSSNLGISNMYIDRPRISIQPLDIYNDPNLGTHA